MRLSARLTPADYQGPFADWRRFNDPRMERAALIATKKAAAIGKNSVRNAMRSASLGRLGNALDDTSDEDQSGKVFRYSNGGFAASGIVFIRSGSERTRGAIESYTGGAKIKPRPGGRWLWISTDEIPRVTGRYRMTPELYVRNGFEQKIGPLVFVKSINGNPLLVVKDTSVAASGRRRGAKSLTKRGALRKGQVAKQFLVAFIGIPRTSRAARVDVAAIMRSVAAQLPAMFNEAIGKI
jgi:hypothetical protein